MQASERYCRQIVRASGSTFAVAFRSLDAQQRRGLHAWYAFCRVVDDIVDGPGTREERAAQLQFWREQLAYLENDEVPHPLTDELRWLQRHFAVPTPYLHELIDGVARDLDPRPIADEADLLQYCYGVAGTVGLGCLHIFRVEVTPEVRAAGIALANAFQLTNILRDLRADLAAGRSYLPANDLADFQVDVARLQAPQLSSVVAARLRDLIVFEAERAVCWYRQAWQGFPAADWPRLRPALLMSDYYSTILQQIRRHPLRVWRERVGVPFRKKLWLLLKRSSSVAVLPDWRPRSI